MADLSELIGELSGRLNRLDALLDAERDCLVGLRYEELLRVVARKRSIQNLLAGAAVLLNPEGDDGWEELRRQAQCIREKALRNQRLAQASLEVVENLRGVLVPGGPGVSTYDRSGCTHRRPRPSTLVDLA